MRAPARSHDFWIEPAFSLKRVGVQQVLGPGSKRSLDPFANGYGKTIFGTINELRWHVFMEQLAQDELTSTASYLHGDRDSGGNLGDVMIEKRNAGLKTDRH